MKKTIHLSLGIFLGMVLLLSGCSSENAETNNSTNSSKQQSEKFSFEMPKKEPEVRGTVKSITGNEVTISVRDLSSLPPEIQKQMEEMQEKMKQARSSGGGMPGANSGMSGGMGMGRPSDGGQPNEEMQKIREAMEKVKTIDTKVIFPVGISMAMRSKEESKEISLADVKVGNQVSVWLDESVTDKKVAQTVMLSPARKQQ